MKILNIVILDLRLVVIQAYEDVTRAVEHWGHSGHFQMLLYRQTLFSSVITIFCLHFQIDLKVGNEFRFPRPSE